MPPVQHSVCQFDQKTVPVIRSDPEYPQTVHEIYQYLRSPTARRLLHHAAVEICGEAQGIKTILIDSTGGHTGRTGFSENTGVPPSIASLDITHSLSLRYRFFGIGLM